jgi:hypothetical protein
LDTKSVATEGSNAVPLTDEGPSLDDLIEADNTPRNGQRCAVCRWYDEQNEATRTSFDRHAAEGTSIRRMYRACQQKGLVIGECQFTRHLKERHGRR